MVAPMRSTEQNERDRTTVITRLCGVADESRCTVRYRVCRTEDLCGLCTVVRTSDLGQTLPCPREVRIYL
eukprot:5434371-Pyramimonas_sp.AAC.1